MKLLTVALLATVLLMAAAFVWTSWQVLKIERDFPPVGSFADLPNGKMHYLDVPAEPDADKRPPIVFVHGASGNLNDPRGAFEAELKGKRRLIFLDRPGHGYSQRAGAETPEQQALQMKHLLDELAIDRAVFVGHSLGAASVAAFAVRHPDQVAGLVFLSPATHPWPGGVTWYYDIASLPIIGSLFTELLVVPIGTASVAQGAKGVFDPNPAPQNYVEAAAIPLVLRPQNFRNNSRDVAGLKEFVTGFSRHYSSISAPTIVITGDKDDVVLPSIHSVGLERDIKGAELIVLEGVGHKPDYARTQVVIDAINRIDQVAR